MPTATEMQFETYGVGPANRAAVEAARAVAESPETAHSPLVLFGSAGVGKTHLLHAIAHAVARTRPTTRVEYLTRDDFAARLHDDADADETARFWHNWGQVDVLLLDDVRPLAEGPETQIELLRILEALHGTGRQVVMTSDRAPGAMSGVDARLVTRLEAGLAVEIGAPDYDTRVAILQAACRGRGVELEPGVVEEIARIEIGNAREPLALLNRILGVQALGEGAVQPDEVLALLDDVPAARAAAGGRGTPPGTSTLDFQSFVTDIASAVAEHVEAWKSHVADAVSRWKAAGYRTRALERLLDEPTAPPNYEAVLRGFAATVQRLRSLEAEAVEADASLSGHDVFRDPERLQDAEAMVQQARAGAVELPGPSVEFSRTGFEVGTSNQHAVRAVDSVAAEPGRRYNPLLIVGPMGVGKTHLLNAVGHEMTDATGGGARVACVNAQQFSDEFIAALRDGNAPQWRARYRRVDALCLDDLQVVAGKERTQEEVFHLMDDLLEAGKQVVCAADRAPKDLPGLDERLRTRFESGLVVEVAPPDQALRAQLYRRFLDGVAEGELDALAAYLAARPTARVGDLIATVQRLTAAADAESTPLTMAVARRELDPAGPTPRPMPTPLTAAPAVRAASDMFFLDDEKVVWDWTDVASRVIEELR